MEHPSNPTLINPNPIKKTISLTMISFYSRVCNVHSVDKERHGLQSEASVCVVVGGVGAGCASVHLNDFDIAFDFLFSRLRSTTLIFDMVFSRLRSTTLIIIWHPQLHPRCLDALLALGDVFNWRLLVENSFALLHCPLQLSGEHPLIVMGLQCISTSEDMGSHLGGGQPITSIRHGSQSNTHATGPCSVVGLCPALLRFTLGNAVFERQA